jgi:hypothetical protein|uniref:Uncharacterized protein n=1 Tax=viral metagenome TaxID=1070528 RepID=A0A6C0IMZ1_9ZZZZ
MIGPTLFIAGMMPSCLAIVRNYCRSVYIHAEYKPSIRYDDELIQNANLALYDLHIALSRSMEDQSLSIHIDKLRTALKNRHKLYSHILQKIPDEHRGIYHYYETRADEFYDVLCKFYDVL